MEKVQVHMVLEILGRPAQHIKDSLKELIETRISKEQGAKVLSYDIKEPLPVKDSQDLYTTFADIEIEFDSLEVFFALVFAYMPAHIEVIRPENIQLRNSDLNLLANRIALRLHDYDSITKRAFSERDMVVKKLYEVAPHLFNKPEGTSAAQVAPEAKKSSKPAKKSKVKKKK